MQFLNRARTRRKIFIRIFGINTHFHRMTRQMNITLAQSECALLHIEQTQVEGVTTAVAVFDSRTDKKDADFVEERRVRVAQTKADAAQAILDVLAEAKLGSMPNTQLRAEVVKETGCSEKTYNRAYGELVKSGEIKKQQLSQQDGARSWYTFLGHWGGTNDQVAI